MINKEILITKLTYFPNEGIFKWNHNFNADVGYICKEYLYIKINYKKYAAHRLAWLYVYGELPSKNIDHINGNKLDNRICNLRQADNFQNLQNQIKPRKDNKTGFLGVYFSNKHKKYIAKIVVNHKRIHLGLFKTKEEAGEAYLKAKRLHHPYGTI